MRNKERIMTELLEKEFTGGGEVKEFKFRQIGSSELAYCYEVKLFDVPHHYEVFLKKNSPVCIDFEKRLYSETEFKESYPKANSFGITAWSFMDKQEAREKLIEISTIKEED